MTEKDLEGLMLMHKRIIENLEEFFYACQTTNGKIKRFCTY